MKIREIIIKMVLATDMATHAKSMSAMKLITEKIQTLPGEEGIPNNQFVLIEEDLRMTDKTFLLG